MPKNDLEFKQLGKKTLFKGFFEMNKYTFKYQQFEGGWSEPFEREIFERGHAAAALLLDPEKEMLILVEQFRPGAVATENHPWLLELVAGIIEEGEQPDEVVCREAEEEAGCKVSKVEKIYEYLVSPGGTTERIWLYLGKVDSTESPEYAGLDHEHEDIKIHKIPVNDAFKMLESGQINNGMTLIALQWLKLNWPNRENFWR